MGIERNEFREWISDLLALGNNVRISPEKVKERFDREDPASYGKQIPKWFPDYTYVHGLILEVLRPYISAESLILDLGGGTGRIAGMLLDAFPSCRLVVQDISANMLSEVHHTLRTYRGRFECMEGDFFDRAFHIEPLRFDYIVFVHAIHHGRDPDVYLRLYQKIFKGLKPGGCFVCLDTVAGETLELDTLNYTDWADSLRSLYDPESIRQIVESTIREDSPLSLREHLDLLSVCGFSRTDVIWKKFIFCLYTGIKSARSASGSSR
jgi:tRNA (cmo5U34)-methyltransferase